MDAEQELEGRSLRELRGSAEPAKAGIELVSDRGVGLLQCLPTRKRRQRARLHGDAGGKAASLLLEVRAVLIPCLVDRLQDAAERGMAGAIGRREVRAGEEGLTARGQKDGHRPPAPSGHRLHRIHVDPVHVGALLAVHLDADEPAIHQVCGGGIFEGLVGHHVAPVARGVSHREQDRDLALVSRGKGLLTPLEPVHRIGGMLKEIGARGVLEAIAARHRLRNRHRTAYLA